MDGVEAANAAAAEIDRKIAVICNFMALYFICQNLARNDVSHFGFKMLLNLLERFTLGVRQEKRRSDEIHNLAAGENEKHLCVTVIASTRQRNCGDRRGEDWVSQARMDSGDEGGDFSLQIEWHSMKRVRT